MTTDTQSAALDDASGRLRRLHELTLTVREAEEQVARCKAEYAEARQTLRECRDQLQAALLADVQDLPLFDRQHYAGTSGDLAAEVQVETAQVPVDQVAPVNGKKRRKKEPAPAPIAHLDTLMADLIPQTTAGTRATVELGRYSLDTAGKLIDRAKDHPDGVGTVQKVYSFLRWILKPVATATQANAIGDRMVDAGLLTE